MPYNEGISKRLPKTSLANEGIYSGKDDNIPPHAPIVWRCDIPSLFELSQEASDTRTIFKTHIGKVILIDSNNSLKMSNCKNISSLKEYIANAPGAIVANRNIVQNTHDKADNFLNSVIFIIITLSKLFRSHFNQMLYQLVYSDSINYVVCINSSTPFGTFLPTLMAVLPIST